MNTKTVQEFYNLSGKNHQETIDFARQTLEFLEKKIRDERDFIFNVFYKQQIYEKIPFDTFISDTQLHKKLHNLLQETDEIVRIINICEFDKYREIAYNE